MVSSFATYLRRRCQAMINVYQWSGLTFEFSPSSNWFFKICHKCNLCALYGDYKTKLFFSYVLEMRLFYFWSVIFLFFWSWFFFSACFYSFPSQLAIMVCTNDFLLTDAEEKCHCDTFKHILELFFKIHGVLRAFIPKLSFMKEINIF